MNKTEFVKFLSEKHSVDKDEARKVVDVFTDSVCSALREGNDIQLIGFGSFAVSDVAARKGRNPKTGADIDIAAYKLPRFKVGKKMKDAVN